MSTIDAKKVPTVLIEVDVHNLDMMLTNLINEKPTDRTRVRYDVLKKYVVDMYPDAQVVASAYMNVREDNYTSVMGWVENALKRMGWNTFVKPKIDRDDDIDEVMVDHIEGMTQNHSIDLVDIVVVSHDTARFSPLLERLANQGHKVTYVVFTELLSPTPSANVEIVDIRDIPDISHNPIPDKRFEKIPACGMWV